ncbi:MAG: arsenosugar biosynthesis radical SAM protein ArsS [Candidatus Latescibacterota bacterium]|nr:MAG: arsenosugar biosynthesis radical SAM protein ArsS [Candidatus Latescibacterota bacterium]
MNDFDRRIREAKGGDLESAGITTIQVNVGLKCNQQCGHCHVAASPKRKESMSWDTMKLIIGAAEKIDCRLVDITGGAPELNPHFRRFVEAVDRLQIPVMVRTNLTVLLAPEMETMPQFYRNHNVQLVASLPCYLEENVDRQRGSGVYRKSIEAIRLLNANGYGRDENLRLSLVYNPVGPHLPPNQTTLEADYRRELKNRFDIDFTNLITITNMPIGRYIGDLRKQNKLDDYMQLLKNAFNPATIDGLMCRHQINVDWAGNIYDCDFNLALNMCVDHGAPTHIRDFDPRAHANRRIVTGNHCFGCTAGCGSSCGGALV